MDQTVYVDYLIVLAGGAVLHDLRVSDFYVGF